MLYCFLSLHQRLTCWFSCFLSSIIESAVGFLDFGYCCIISPNSRTRHSQLCESTIINVHHFKRALLLHKNAKQLQIRKPNQLFRRLWQDAIIEKIVRAKNHRFFFFLDNEIQMELYYRFLFLCSSITWTWLIFIVCDYL